MHHRSFVRRFRMFGYVGALVLLLCLTVSQGQSQTVPATQPPTMRGGGDSGTAEQDGLTPQQYQKIQAALAQSRAQLVRQGKLSPVHTSAAVLFAWPLHPAPGVTLDYGYHGVSNFVDHNSNFPDQLLDYNNGRRTYDLATGYNHAGTDFILTPFAWKKMDAGEIQIVAAADGVILLKQDGNFDRNCSMGDASWNAVYIQHSDGTVAWYGHMRKDSLTAKLVGDTVAMGEYLGLVGSSGSSTIPHLHFEVHTANDTITDPFVGPANPSISTSLWQTQPAYYDSAINHLGTGTAPPVFPPCPQPETSNEQTRFDPGSTIYFTSYHRDEIAGQDSQYRIYRPDNSLYTEWTRRSTAEYMTWSYWYNPITIAPTEPLGLWRFEVIYQNRTYQHTFYIGSFTQHLALPIIQN